MTNIKPQLERQMDKILEPFLAFIRAQTTASSFLLLALLAAIFLVNSSWENLYEAIQHFRMGVLFGDYKVTMSLQHLVNDGLIALFFFLIGLEVKRELLAGELQAADKVRLLLAAACGGMLLPAGIYLLINTGMAGGEIHGWGIPMATDTAIAIGVLAALAARVPRSVVAFLVGVAIIDDIGAILVIALVYTEQLFLPAIFVGLVLLLVLLLFNQAGLRHPLFYFFIGVLLWIAIVESGIHASIAGVVVAATVPARPRLRPRAMKRKVRGVVASVPPETRSSDVLAQARTHRQIAKLERLAQDATTPLRRWEDGLEMPVALLVLPLFVFLNAGMLINTDALAGIIDSPVALGILAGLLLGKPLGIFAGVKLAERIGWAQRAIELNDKRLLGVGLLAGVGFTMSTFITHLALGRNPASLETAKLAIVAASVVAAMSGYVMLRRAADVEKQKL
ncbi:MAG: Na+/H+ antiporter NhaA [Chromatiales bacterium]|jgi:NhaA family Na+:H+ antiporter